MNINKDVFLVRLLIFVLNDASTFSF